MSIEDDCPALTEMLDAHFRGVGDGDDAAVEAFVATAGDGARERVLTELRALAAMQHDPFELRGYLMLHRFDMIPDEGAEAWLHALAELLERAF